MLESRPLGVGSFGITDRGIVTDPELDRAGMTESEARQAGSPIKVAPFVMKKNGKAKEIGKTSAAQPFLLVVDDDEMNRDMLSRRLQRRGYDVAVAHDSEHALELIRDYRFDLVLLDVMMPGLNGLEVLRESHTATDLPIIMATAREESAGASSGGIGCAHSQLR